MRRIEFICVRRPLLSGLNMQVPTKEHINIERKPPAAAVFWIYLLVIFTDHLSGPGREMCICVCVCVVRQ